MRKNPETFKSLIEGLRMNEPVDETPSVDNLIQGYSSKKDIAKMNEKRIAYMIGFAASVVRDFDCGLHMVEIPYSRPGYDKFIVGASAESLPIPTPNQDESSYTFRMDNYLISHDENYYNAGLRAWLSKNDAAKVPVNMVRHPEALKAFKAKLFDSRSVESEQLLAGYQTGDIGYYLTLLADMAPDIKAQFLGGGPTARANRILQGQNTDNAEKENMFYRIIGMDYAMAVMMTRDANKK